MSEIEWDNTQYNVMIGVQKALVLASYAMGVSGNKSCVLLQFPESDTIWSLRWKVQALVDLGTNDLNEAKGAIAAMIAMEGGRHGG